MSSTAILITCIAILAQCLVIALYALLRAYRKLSFYKIPPQIFFIADTHFDDSYAVKKSPFHSTRTMNEVIRNNWNRKVSRRDIIYVLGDFCAHRYHYWCAILNGKKIFIRGNHDKGGNKYFEYITLGDRKFLLLHDPCKVPPDYDGWAIHGHIHESYMVNTGRKLFCVSVLPPKIGPISKLDLAMIKQQPWTTFFASHPTPV